ncbi:MAG: hypothetical protein P4L65_03815 [Legionella sp.]|nr:hypothetical protein [Legionella sp.]
MNIYKKYLYKIIFFFFLFISIIASIFIINTRYIPNYPVVRYPFEYLKIKKELPKLKQHNKIIVLSGSNAFYGFRTELFEKYTGRPTINMAIQGSLGISFMLYYIKPVLQRGDILILPIEYGVLLSNNNHNYISAHVSYAFGLDYFKTIPLSERIEYLRALKSNYFNDSLKRRVIGAPSFPLLHLERCVNSNGDMICNESTEESKVGLHKLLINQGPQDRLFINPDNEELPDYASLKIVSNFLSWAKDNGVTVVGTYPNSVDFLIKDKALVKKIKSWYLNHGQIFIGESSESFFQENMMYDTIYHLNAEGAELRTRLFSQRFCKETNYCKRHTISRAATI